MSFFLKKIFGHRIQVSDTCPWSVGVRHYIGRISYSSVKELSNWQRIRREPFNATKLQTNFARMKTKSHLPSHRPKRRRKANRDMAMEKLNDGDANTASELFQRAVSVTPLMAHRLIQSLASIEITGAHKVLGSNYILRSENIEFVVAPYEADAQLAYLAGLEAEEGGVVAIVFKMDRYGNGEEIMLNKVFNADGHVPSFKNFDRELFTGMCVMAGCDFLPSVPGIGIAKAYNLVAKYRNLARIPSHSSEVWCISQALSVLKFEKGKIMPEDYDTAFKEALAVFQHAE
ncbi:Exonuclease 1, partial [Sesamum angolense]